MTILNDLLWFSKVLIPSCELTYPFEIFLRVRTTWRAFSFGSCLVVLKKTPENDPPRYFSISPPKSLLDSMIFLFPKVGYGWTVPWEEFVGGLLISSFGSSITGEICVVLVFSRVFGFLRFYIVYPGKLTWQWTTQPFESMYLLLKKWRFSVGHVGPWPSFTLQLRRVQVSPRGPTRGGKEWTRFRATWATKKPSPTFHYTGWLVGILIMAYYKPYLTG